jgi:hypothetical protein
LLSSGVTSSEHPLAAISVAAPRSTEPGVMMVAVRGTMRFGQFSGRRSIAKILCRIQYPTPDPHSRSSPELYGCQREM